VNPNLRVCRAVVTEADATIPFVEEVFKTMREGFKAKGIEHMAEQEDRCQACDIVEESVGPHVHLTMVGE